MFAAFQVIRSYGTPPATRLILLSTHETRWGAIEAAKDADEAKLGNNEYSSWNDWAQIIDDTSDPLAIDAWDDRGTCATLSYDGAAAELGHVMCPNCLVQVDPEDDTSGCGCHCPDCGATL